MINTAIKKAIDPAALRGFAMESQLYKIMRDRILENATLKTWFEKLVQSTTDHERISAIVQKLYDYDKKLSSWL